MRALCEAPVIAGLLALAQWPNTTGQLTADHKAPILIPLDTYDTAEPTFLSLRWIALWVSSNVSLGVNT